MEKVFNVNKIRGIMAEKRVTQETLAKALKIAPSTLNFKLSSKSPFTIKEVEDISKYFNVEIAYFFN